MKVGSRISLPLDDAPVRSGPIGVVRAPVDLDETLPIGQPARLRSASPVLPMRCLRCQGTVERGTAPVRVERNGYRLAWEDVPAWVCGRCELAYFEPREVDTIRRALNAMQALSKV
ncbi:MAG TPA: YgiT-type zinc finger protein [Thermoanaerobaculia bacterium]|nr:YgiT-type zinc finger protein [Thermoanaerobaculia bacterium]